MSNLYTRELKYLFLIFLNWHCTYFLPFHIMSHWAFIIFDIISSRRRFLLFDVFSRSAFITFVLMSFCRYLQFDVLPIFVFTIQRFSRRPFVPFNVLSANVFYRRRFLLWLFVGEAFSHLTFFICNLIRIDSTEKSCQTQLYFIYLLGLKSGITLMSHLPCMGFTLEPRTLKILRAHRKKGTMPSSKKVAKRVWS